MESGQIPPKIQTKSNFFKKKQVVPTVCHEYCKAYGSVCKLLLTCVSFFSRRRSHPRLCSPTPGPILSTPANFFSSTPNEVTLLHVGGAFWWHLQTMLINVGKFCFFFATCEPCLWPVWAMGGWSGLDTRPGDIINSISASSKLIRLEI